MKKRPLRSSLLIPVDEAQEIVGPYELSDILRTLQRQGLICRFAVGKDYVAIEPAAGKRIEAALLYLEATAGVPCRPGGRDGELKQRGTHGKKS